MMLLTSAIIRRLNPYSNGIYSMSDVNQFSMDSFALGLNPYSNGIYSMRGIGCELCRKG